MPRPFLIDTDAGSDDAVAVLMALRHSDIDVKAITVVAGNVPLEQGIQNTLYFAELCKTDTPVYAGADRPLIREYVSADWFHGADGLGDWGDRYKPRRSQVAVRTCRRRDRRDGPVHAGYRDRNLGSPDQPGPCASKSP